MCNVSNKVRLITTANESYIVDGVSRLCTRLGFTTDFREQCIAHAFNLAIQDSLKVVAEKIKPIRTVIHSIRAPVQGRQMYEKRIVELGS